MNFSEAQRAETGLERLPRVLIMGRSHLPEGQHSRTQTVPDDHAGTAGGSGASPSPPLPGPFFQCGRSVISPPSCPARISKKYRVTRGSPLGGGTLTGVLAFSS
jgi:hypothetical protein